MMTDQWDYAFTLSLFANTSVTVMGIIFAPMVTWMLITRWHHLEKPTRYAMFALVTLAWYLVFRIGYWSPTMWLSDVQTADRYHPMWIQYRWLSYGPAAVLGLLGIGLLMASIANWGKRTMAIVVGISIAAGLAVALTWQMSELGYWFDRQAVIEAHDRFFGYER